jgi:hypothetical protein
LLSNPITNLRPSRRLLRIVIHIPKQGFRLSAYLQPAQHDGIAESRPAIVPWTCPELLVTVAVDLTATVYALDGRHLLGAERPPPPAATSMPRQASFNPKSIQRNPFRFSAAAVRSLRSVRQLVDCWAAQAFGSLRRLSADNCCGRGCSAIRVGKISHQIRQLDCQRPKARVFLKQPKDIVRWSFVIDERRVGGRLHLSVI